MEPGALPAFDAETGDLNVIIETPKGSHIKFSYDEQTGLFTLSKLLPAGMVFPFNFGFVPFTRGGDGDPLDVLLVFDEPLFPGCLTAARVIGALKAQQSEKGKMKRNDRLLAVPVLPIEYSPPRSIHELDKQLLYENYTIPSGLKKSQNIFTSMFLPQSVSALSSRLCFVVPLPGPQIINHKSQIPH
jgi:inorganic pyrophosphatase